MKRTPESQIIKKAGMLIIAILTCELAGVIGSLFTIPNIESWYEQLEKPEFRPPNWLFSPVWITLYALMGVSLYLIYTSGHKERIPALAVFAVQLALNVLWSFAFFGLQSPLYGLIVILLLWISIVYMIFRFYQINRIAALLQVPYLLWVSFAGILNYFILIMN
ncbi:MAG: TspO/MBR family protein [Candidatus Micrarchaeia archaeon]